MQESICSNKANLRDLLKAINAAPAGIAFLVESDNVLVGIVTDGDFRRMLLRGKELTDSIENDDYGEFIYARQGEDIQTLVRRTDKRVRVIPIVDDEMHLVDYFRYEHRTHFTPVAEPDLSGNELKYVTDAVLSTWVSSSGEYINRFEDEFSSYCECEYGVATANGTVALHLALVALGIGENDEVIIPDLTFAATANAVILANATPVLVDVEADSWCIDPDKIEEAITPKTKAIIPVHLYGQPADLQAILAIAKKHNLYVVEDAAEAHGARFSGRRVGSYGDIGCFSFYGNKIITTGEGGMCVTNNPELNSRMRKLRDHGMNKDKRYWHDEVGFNYRMTNLQAALGCAQLERIDQILDLRRRLEHEYREAFAGLDLFQWQNDLPDRERVVWLVVALYNGNRAQMISEMKSHGIDIRPFFYPLSEMPPYHTNQPNPVTSRLSQVGVNLPTVKNVDINRVRELFEALASSTKLT